MRINDSGPEYATFGHCEHKGMIGGLLRFKQQPEKVSSITMAGATISPSPVSVPVAWAPKKSPPLAKSTI
jgi:hypothetical protein